MNQNEIKPDQDGYRHVHFSVLLATKRESVTIDEIAVKVMNSLQDGESVISVGDLSTTLKKLSTAICALKDISKWDEDMEEEWGDPGERALEALKLIKEKQNKPTQ